MRRLQILKNKRVTRTLLTFCVIAFLYGSVVNHNEPTHIGIARNIVSGNMWLQEGGGFFLNPPWVLVTRIDTRPIRVVVPTSGRAYNAKLVQFNIHGWEEFVALEGWRYYWLANRFSFNWGYREESRGVKDILRGYAYSPKQYSFLVVLKEYNEE